MNKTEPVVILAGGFGTRLKDVLDGLPKPLVDINGTPFIKFTEKENKNNSGLINSGFYKLHTNIFKNYKKNIYSIENDLFPLLIIESKLFGKIIDTNFTDIGIPSDYFNFCELNKKQKIKKNKVK